jgi:hypothetical protein
MSFDSEIHEKILVDGIEKGFKLITTLDDAKRNQIMNIKHEAGNRIKALDWKLERAARHAYLASQSIETSKSKDNKEAVYVQIQQIEEASDEAEIDVNLLDDIEQVKQFTW